MKNMPEVKLGIVAVSRDCFPITLSESRRKAVAAEYLPNIYQTVPKCTLFSIFFLSKNARQSHQSKHLAGVLSGGRNWFRTSDLLNVSQALSH